MAAFIITAIIGAVCIVLGITNMHGNISTLHSYHRHRVKEEDRIPFGRLVGIGTIIIGIGIIIFSGISAITLYTGESLYTIIGAVILILTLIVGTAISFYAMKKYNKGIF